MLHLLPILGPTSKARRCLTLSCLVQIERVEAPFLSGHPSMELLAGEISFLRFEEVSHPIACKPSS